MATFIPTKYALIDLALRTGRQPDDPVVAQLFDALVLSGYLAPYLPDWWEVIRWRDFDLDLIAQEWR